MIQNGGDFNATKTAPESWFRQARKPAACATVQDAFRM